MTKKIVFLTVFAVILAGCTQNTNSVVNQTAPESKDSYNQDEAMNQTDEQGNEAAFDAENSQTEGNLPAESENLTINPSTNNMNTAIIKTSLGTIKVKLNPEKAPVTVENFKQYASSEFYNGTIFHRVIPNFMVQGGGFLEDATQKETNAPIKIESDNGLKNLRGTIAMARTQVPDSATSQFFINLVDNDFLNYRSPDMQGYGYAVFGEVIEGMDVVDAIAQVKTGATPMADWPVETVMIESVTLAE